MKFCAAANPVNVSKMERNERSILASLSCAAVIFKESERATRTVRSIECQQIDRVSTGGDRSIECQQIG